MRSIYRANKAKNKVEYLEAFLDDFEKNLPQLKLKNRNGFEFAKINIDKKIVYALKVFHPSMHSFGAYNESTQKIISWFLGLQKS